MKYLRYVALLALLAMPLAYSQAAVVVGAGVGVGLELESAWLARPFALTVITRIIRMLARPTVTTARAGSPAACLSAQARGTTAGDIRIMDGPTRTALRIVVSQFGAALKDAARSQSTAEGSTVAADR